MVIKSVRIRKSHTVRGGRRVCGFKIHRAGKDCWHVIDRTGFTQAIRTTCYHAERAAEKLADEELVKRIEA